MDTLIKTLRRIGAYLITNTSGHLVTLSITPLALWALSTTGHTGSPLEDATITAALITLSPLTATGPARQTAYGANHFSARLRGGADP